MARTIATNFTGGLQFPYATAATDIFKKEDVQTLAVAVDQHTHGAGKGLVLGAGAIPSGFVLPSPHFTSPVVDSGGLTIAAGGLTIAAGNLAFSGVTAIINGGSTTTNFNNWANSATNLTITDGGSVTISRGNLAFGAAAAIINGGSSTLNFNNNANNATNLTISDTGGITLRPSGIGAKASGDHYLVMSAAGVVHLSTLEP